MKWMVVLLVAAGGCAGASANRHVAAAPSAWARPPYALDIVELAPPRAGQLSASREWERSPSNRAVHAIDDAELRQTFVDELARTLPLDAASPRRLRATLTLQDTGYYEGLAAETSDVTLTAEVFDDHGNLLRTITMREPASAPLQRSASRRQRLRAAIDRLAERLSAVL